jgi:hypothetical protein
MQLRQDIATPANWAFAHEQNKLKEVNQSAKRLLKNAPFLE